MPYQYRSVRLRRRGFYKFTLLRLKILNNLTTVIISGFVGLIILGFLTFVWLSKDLPLPDKVQRKEGFSTVITDRDSKPIYDIYEDVNRIPLSYSDMPEMLKKATIAIEDKDFYKHQGFDPKGIFRAFFNILTFKGLQGGSTLTQQLVKNVLLSQERTLPRKIKEFILAVQIESKYKKDEILQMYLNEAPYGGTMWGIESAAEGYFGKHAKDLTPLESLVLAGFPQRPSYYSPLVSENKTAYIKRSEEVLRRLKEDGNITVEEEYNFRRELPTLKFSSFSASMRAPHFVLWIKKQLTDLFGEAAVEKGGLKVTTTLDRDLQEKTETIIKEELAKLKNLKVSNGAALIIDPSSGEILAYAGSKEYDSEDTNFEGKFDVVSLGLRQPGSALKPITYAASFMKGYTPASVIMDVETEFPSGSEKENYKPKNYDGKFRGPIQLRFALGNSINIPAVKMTALVGVKDILKLSSDMGLTTLNPTDENIRKLGLSLTLGGGEVRLMELVSAYGVFATGGIKNETYGLLKVTDRNGKTIYEHKKIQGKRVLGEDIAFLISHILSDNNARKDIFGERSYLVIPGKTVSVKTGTTDDKRDNWTIGYTPSLVAGVWVGNNNNSAMDPKLASGVTGAAPIWNRIIKEGLKDKPDEQLKKPNNVISLEIDAFAGGLAHDGRSTRSEYFIKGTEPTSISLIYQKIRLSKSDNNKLANQVEIATNAYDEKEFIVFKENDPTGSGKNLWQEGIDKWLMLQSDNLYHPPKDTSSASENSVVVKIKNPADKTKIDSNTVTIRAEAKAIKDIHKIEIYVDDSLKTTVNNNSLEENLNMTDGIHKIKVKAYNSANDSGEAEITVGIKTDPNTISPTPISATALPPSPTLTIPVVASPT